MLELVPPGRVLFLRPLKRGGARVAWDAIWVHASDIIREVRVPPHTSCREAGCLTAHSALCAALPVKKPTNTCQRTVLLYL